MVQCADESLRVPPNNAEAERAALGAMLCNGDAVDVVAGIIGDHDFYGDGNAIIFRELVAMRQDGIPADAVTLSERLDAAGKLEEIGGLPAILQILETVPHAAHCEYYAGIVRKESVRRHGVYAATKFIRDIHDKGSEPDDAFGTLESELHAIIERNAGTEAIDVRDALVDLQAALEAGETPGVATGFVDLDGILNGGLKPGALAVLAARPSVGKTSFVSNVALNVAKHGHGVLFISLEQSSRELTTRLLASVGGISAKAIASGNVDRTALMEAQNQLAGWPIQICDSASLSVQQIAAMARVQKRRRHLELCIIDYLQLIQPSDARIPREQQVATMTRSLKCTAKDLQIPIIVLAQLNRSIETRENKRPRLSDLRESGAIEQDADLVTFLDRPATYDTNKDPSEATAIVAKNRNGEIGDVSLVWDGPTMTFSSAAKPWQRF